MVYTVKQLSKLSGVTVRTLHFYEEVGLLRPSYYGDNGYRYYEEKELLQLQQILFYKELGLSLKQIQKVLGKSDFDLHSALLSHKEKLLSESERLTRLLSTIDNTLAHLKGKKRMKEEEMYQGFITKEKQKEYLEYLKNRFDQDFSESAKKAGQWTKSEWESCMKDSESNFEEIKVLMEQEADPSSYEVQEKIQKLYEWVLKFWTPNKESFTALGQMYTEFEWKQYFGKYDDHHPRFAKYVARGMKIFAETTL